MTNETIRLIVRVLNAEIEHHKSYVGSPSLFVAAKAKRHLRLTAKSKANFVGHCRDAGFLPALCDACGKEVRPVGETI